MWDDVPEGVQGDRWAELDDNGWGALIGWYAGVQNLRRQPVNDTARTILVTRTSVSGTAQTEEPFSPADRALIDEEANSYLADAGVPPRPDGFTWFIHLPEQFPAWEDFRCAVTEAVYETAPEASHPSEIAPAMRVVVQSYYQ